MTASEQSPAPSSWRDVYQLVRDTREDVLGAVAKVDVKVTRAAARIDAIESDRRDEKVARETEAALAEERDQRAQARTSKIAAIAGAGRSTIALIISIAAFALVVVRG